MNGARNMALCNVCNFVSQYTREFILTARRLKQTCMDTDEAAGQSKGVDTVVVNDEEREVDITVVGLCRNSVAHFIDVFGNQRIFDNTAAVHDVTHDRTAESCLFIGRENRVGRASHVRQLDVVGASAANQYKRGESGCHGEFSEAILHRGFDPACRSAFQLIQCLDGFQYLSGMAFDLDAAPLIAQFARTIDEESAAHNTHKLSPVQGFLLDDIELPAQGFVRIRNQVERKRLLIPEFFVRVQAIPGYS